MAYQTQSRERRDSRGGGGRGPGRPGARDARKREKKDDVLGGRMRRKTCRFCEEKLVELDYKDIKRLERLVSERGKILSRRVTGMCARHQRWVEEAVKKARFVALLPFLKK